MARVRRTTALSARQAGERYNQLQPNQGVPNVQIPINPRLTSQYRYIVDVVLRHDPTGTVETRRVVVVSSTRLTRDEVTTAAEDLDPAEARTSPPLAGSITDYTPNTLATEILYAERRS